MEQLKRRNHRSLFVDYSSGTARGRGKGKDSVAHELVTLLAKLDWHLLSDSARACYIQDSEGKT